MKIKMLTLEFHLPGCRTLKDKRHRLIGVKDRFGKQPNMAVCESDYHDKHDRASWSFLAVTGSNRINEKMLAEVETYATEELDAVIVATSREEF